MLNLFLMLATCGQLFTVEVVPVTGFTVEVDQDAPAEPPEKEALPANRKKCLTMFSIASCPPCRRVKANVLPKLKEAGYHYNVIDMDLASNQRKYGNRVSRYPSFLVTDYETGEWLSAISIGEIDLDAAKWMLDSSGASTPEQEKQAAKVVESPASSSPPRFIQWPGWGQIDLETYNRNCDCPMCQSIRVMQREYRLKKSEAKVTPDQEGTPDEIVNALLDSLELRSGDVVADLGAGDGRICIAAAKRGYRAIGVEIDPARAAVARQKVQDAGVAHLVTIEEGDALDFDTSRATVVTAYLYPPLLEKLAPKLRKVRRVASPYHPIPGLTMVKLGQVYFTKD